MTHPVSLRVLDLDALRVDHAYQRPVHQTHVARIAANLRPELLGVLEISQREDGSYWIIDGQQRWEALRLHGGYGKARCNVHRGLTREDEARLYEELNRYRKQVSALERFLARVFYGEEDALAIEAIVKRHGMAIGKTNGRTEGTLHHIEAVAVLERIYNWRRGPAVLDEALRLAQYWRGDPKSNNGMWLQGLAYFARDHDTDLLSEKQVERIQALVPAVIIRRATADVSTLGGSSGGESIGRAIAVRLRKAARVRAR